MVDFERFEVWSFQGEHHASSFRSPVPSPQFLEAIKQLVKEAPSHHWSTTADSKRRVRSGEGKPFKSLPVSHSHEKVSDTGVGAGESPRFKLTKEDLRKLRKFQRDKEVRRKLAYVTICRAKNIQ